ncbi:DUF2510 domain-containing protein [Streptomyces pactum]|uniref:DUF2510 domain-containing protein n=1 Tax=Streptomyces pactum TaxID=68249 RepID=A0A1S6JFK1_9ACTN|nr:DUF2510 domain-containing protein [Streptomyces pactum]AQS70482.1 hypothetical protein B1H29_29520 [Streptomyces pactum]
MTPPPGWYRDPSAPHQERWWDGTAWTEHRRAPEPTGFGAPPPPQQPVPQQPVRYQQPMDPWQAVPHMRPGQASTVPLVTGAGPGQQRSAGGGGRGKAVALTTAAAVLVAAIVTGVFVLGDDDGPEARTPPATATSTVPEPVTATPTPSPTPTESSADTPAVVEDQLNGITFPLPDGWVLPKYVTEDDVMMTTDGTYDCPGDGGVCRHGLVISRTVTANAESSPKVLAEQDIEDAADDAYDRDLIGNKPFGGLESHEQVASGPVAVAGRAGYYVRWRVKTAKGPGGYVQSMVFPSTVGTESPILVRYVFDAGEDGPPLDDMDRITEGIRPVGDADTGGGVGSGIGPSN